MFMPSEESIGLEIVKRYRENWKHHVLLCHES